MKVNELLEAKGPNRRAAKAAYKKFEDKFMELFPKFNPNKVDGWPQEMLVGSDGVHYMSFSMKPGGTSWFKIDGKTVIRIKSGDVPNDAVEVEEIFAE